MSSASPETVLTVEHMERQVRPDLHAGNAADGDALAAASRSSRRSRDDTVRHQVHGDGGEVVMTRKRLAGAALAALMAVGMAACGGSSSSSGGGSGSAKGKTIGLSMHFLADDYSKAFAD